MTLHVEINVIAIEKYYNHLYLVQAKVSLAFTMFFNNSY